MWEEFPLKSKKGENMKLALVKDGKVEVVELSKEHDYRDLKRLLEIDSPLDCIERKVNGKTFDIWIDDEGALKDDEKITAMTIMERKEGKRVCEFILGNLIIAHHDGEGNTTGLSDEEIELVKGAMKKLPYAKYLKPIEWVGAERSFREDGALFVLGI